MLRQKHQNGTHPYGPIWLIERSLQWESSRFSLLGNRRRKPLRRLRRSSEATIVRLDRVGEKNSFRVLDRAVLKSIAVDPLLQSARVLDGIFYPAAMVVEADSDARFYHAASHKLSPKADIHTVNAQNKQTVARVASLYRKLGLRCAGIVDFDVINDRGEFASHLDALGMTEAERQDVLSV